MCLSFDIEIRNHTLFWHRTLKFKFRSEYFPIEVAHSPTLANEGEDAEEASWHSLSHSEQPSRTIVN